MCQTWSTLPCSPTKQVSRWVVKSHLLTLFNIYKTGQLAILRRVVVGLVQEQFSNRTPPKCQTDNKMSSSYLLVSWWTASLNFPPFLQFFIFYNLSLSLLSLYLSLSFSLWSSLMMFLSGSFLSSLWRFLIGSGTHFFVLAPFLPVVTVGNSWHR